MNISPYFFKNREQPRTHKRQPKSSVFFPFSFSLFSFSFFLFLSIFSFHFDGRVWTRWRRREAVLFVRGCRMAESVVLWGGQVLPAPAGPDALPVLRGVCGGAGGGGAGAGGGL